MSTSQAPLPPISFPSSSFASSTPPIPPTTASKTLRQFLSLAAIDPSRRPDSTLSNRGDGPQSNSGGTGNINLSLYHLDRIAQGIKGENLGVGKLAGVEGLNDDAVVDMEGGGSGGRSSVKRRRVEKDEKNGGSGSRAAQIPIISTGDDDNDNNNNGGGGDKGDVAQEDQWLPKPAYDLTQSLTQSEVGDRDPTDPSHSHSQRPHHMETEIEIGDEALAEVLHERAGGDEEKADGNKRPLTAKEKEERKKRKMARRKEEKRKKAGGK